MLRIDADAHVLETEKTWEYMEGDDRKFRPQIVISTDRSPNDEYWLVDGTLRLKSRNVGAFHNMIMDGIPKRFPKLKVAFLEAGAQWLPYVLNDLGKRYKLQGRELNAKELLQQSRFYVGCETTDDLPYIMEIAGEDNLVVGTDYGHADSASETESSRRRPAKL